MKILKPTLIFVVIALLSGCSAQGDTLAPRKIGGKKILFYTTNSQQTTYLHKNYIFVFHTQGTYLGSLKGSLKKDEGDFSYALLKSKNRARLMISFSTLKENHIFEYTMTFKTPTSGTWSKVTKEDQCSSYKEKGTFKILN